MLCVGLGGWFGPVVGLGVRVLGVSVLSIVF